jgi:glycerol-3-phosphate dehydrogenase subunit C
VLPKDPQPVAFIPMAYTFDPDSPEFYDRDEVEREERRVFDICHDCRRCYNLCPSFNTLLDGIDVAMEGKDAAGEVSSLLERKTVDAVVDQCFQCKLCVPHCPYTPPHRWQIDFPRLMLRSKAARVRRKGMPIVDRVLANPERMGRVGTLAAKLANRANNNRLFRGLMEKTLGIHRYRNLPRYASQPFEKWFAKRGTRSAGENGKAALFYTCTVNFNETETGKAAVQVLERNKIAVSCPAQQCCGMPALDGGDIEGARLRARENVAALAAAVREGCDVVVPGPTCSFMLKKEYPLLVKGPEADQVAAHTFDLCEYLMKLHKAGKLDTGFATSAGRVAYHVPCHLRVQNIGFKSRDLMKLLPDTQIELIESCSGVDGTWGFKKEYFDLSLKVARGLYRGIENAGTATIATDCPLAGLQIELKTGKKPEHPIEIVRRGYGIVPER